MVAEPLEKGLGEDIEKGKAELVDRRSVSLLVGLEGPMT